MLKRNSKSTSARANAFCTIPSAWTALVAHVIDYSDDLSWIKLTVDLSGTEQFILDPLTPAGARFSKKIRELVTGLTTKEALRILRNLPEVDNADIRLWPPWNSSLPRIPAHITIETLLRSSSAR